MDFFKQLISNIIIVSIYISGIIAQPTRENETISDLARKANFHKIGGHNSISRDNL
jgi:hypothetical protein